MVVSIYEKEKIKRLNEKNIIEETLYYNPNNNSGEIFVRSSDGKMSDEINYKAIKEKRYFFNGECIFVEKDFDKDFLYNIINYDDENEVVKCSNCGNSGKISEFINGCEYCGAVFNFGINDINNSKKQFNYQFHFKQHIIIYIIVAIINFVVTLLLLLLTKNLVLNFLLISIPFILLFSIGPALIISICITLAKQKNNLDYGYEKYNDVKWKIQKDEKIFYNNLKAELMIKLYEQVDLIDFEIIDYLNFDFLSEDELIVTCKIRELYYKDKISACEEIYKIKTHHNNTKLDKTNNMIYCSGCGNTISVLEEKCNYCDRINDFKNEWIIDSIEKVSNNI